MSNPAVTHGLPDVPSGPAAAALIAAGAGCLALGVLVPLAEASPAVKNLLNWWNPVGPLSGKTGVAVVVWLVVWAVLAGLWREREVNFGKAYALSLVLILLGFVGTFPPVFELFTAH